MDVTRANTVGMGFRGITVCIRFNFSSAVCRSVIDRSSSFSSVVSDDVLF